MSDDLRTLIDFAAKRVADIFRKNGRVLAMYHAIREDGSHFVTLPPSDDKDVSVALMKAAFELENVSRYVYIDEAWVLDIRNRTDQEIDLPRIERTGLRNHPDRREIVTYLAENRHGGNFYGRQFILRPERGKPSLSPLVLEDASGFNAEGRMTGLLSQKVKSK